MAEKTPLTAEETRKIAALRAAAAAGNFYELLGVHRRASPPEIEAAYKDYVRAWHPDRFYARNTGVHGIDIEDNFVSVTRAYRTLRDPKRRESFEREFTRSGGVLPEPDRSDVSDARGGSEPPTQAHEVQFNRTVAGKASTQAKAPAEPAEPPKMRLPPILEKMKAQVAEQLARAKSYYDAGKTDFEEGRFTKAESALYLATRYDPKNVEYQMLHQEAVKRAKQVRAATYMQLAEQAEQYSNVRDAIANYRKVIEADPPEGGAWFALANLIRVHEDDDREALNLLRRAVMKEPRNVRFRLALGEAYLALEMPGNALREGQAALEIDGKNEAAKALVQKSKGKR